MRRLAIRVLSRGIGSLELTQLVKYMPITTDLCHFQRKQMCREIVVYFKQTHPFTNFPRLVDVHTVKTCMLCQRTSAWRQTIYANFWHISRSFFQSLAWRKSKTFKKNVSCVIFRINNPLTVSANIFAPSDVCGFICSERLRCFFHPLTRFLQSEK